MVLEDTGRLPAEELIVEERNGEPVIIDPIDRLHAVEFKSVGLKGDVMVHFTKNVARSLMGYQE